MRVEHVKLEGPNAVYEITLDDGLTLRRDREPKVCPTCNRPSKFEELSGDLVNTERLAVEATYRCGFGDCGRSFIAVYEPHLWEEKATGWTEAGASKVVRHGELRLTRVGPLYPAKAEVPPDVASISPSFGAIFEEAAAAEAFSLKQVAGCGYRKALEFLIKDHAIALLDPSLDSAQRQREIAAIQGARLANVIDERIPAPRVRECAKRAAWLGNDETHYTRRWEAQDVEDLKVLIRLTIIWIESEQLTKRYIGEMPERK